MSGAPFVSIEGVSKTYATGGWLGGGQGVAAVDTVSATVGRGETLGIVGESGCGKSTLGRLVVHLEQATGGRVLIDGTDVARLRGGPLKAFRRRVQMIFQDPYASLNPRVSVGDSIGEPLRNYLGLSGKALRDRIAELAAECGLSDHHIDRYPHELSGGQCQRVGIARAIALGPDVIVADEPVSALDVSIQAQILNLVARLQRQMGLTLIFISHDMAVVRHVSDRVAVMYLGRIVETGATEDVFERPRHPYTQVLLAALPRPVPSARRVRREVTGELPSPLDPPTGCHFHPRCAFATERCTAERPVLRVPDDARAAGHVAACHHAETIPPFQTGPA